MLEHTLLVTIYTCKVWLLRRTWSKTSTQRFFRNEFYVGSMRKAWAVLIFGASCELLLFSTMKADRTTEDPATIPVSSVQAVSDQVTLVAAPQVLHFGDSSVPGMTYNGDYTGPLLKVKAGGTLRVHLVNHLSQDTNLHFHGILASPLGHSDNMMIHVNPGQSFDYQVKVPEYQTPGLYWYHTHIHGETSRNVNAGLSGPLLVEGPSAPPITPAPTEARVMVLKEYEVERARSTTFQNQFRGNILTINGQINTVLTLRPGQHQLWYVGNLSPNRPFQLTIQGHHFTIIGRDGIPSLHPTIVETLDVDPGSRYAVLIDAGTAGDFSIRGSDDDGDGRGHSRGRGRRTCRNSENGDDAEGVLLGTLHVSGTSLAPKPIPVLAPSPTQDLASAHIDTSRLIVFGEDGRDYTINGKTFDHARVDTRVRLGNIEEWTIRNDTRDMHVFHIHQVTFQVVNINGQPQTFNGMVDTVRIVPRASVVIRIAFTHPEIVGRFMYHCHVLEHEDHGMMAQIEVYDPKQASEMREPGMPSMALPP